MKKLSFVIMALVGFVLMTGCKKDPVAPTLSLMTGEGYLSEGSEIMVGEPFRVGLQCNADKLSALNIIFMKGEAFATEDTENWNNASTATYDRSFIIMYEGDITMTATLFDTHGQTTTVVVNFKSLPVPEPEPDPAPTMEGRYQGTINMTATASALGVSYPFEAPFPMEISFSEAEEEGRLNATIIYEEQVYTTTGVYSNDTFILEPFDIELDILGSTATVTMAMLCSIGDAVLSVQGAFAGSGNIIIPDMQGFAIPATIEGNLEGDLDKAE